MRRKTREVSGPENIAVILEKTGVCRLGLCDGDRPYVLPLHFAYELEEGKFVIYCHSAIEGRKLDVIARNPNACFEADIAGEIIKGDTPCEWSGYYESVIGSGRVEILNDSVRKSRALGLIMARFGFEGQPEFNPAVLARTAAIRLVLDEISAKRHDANQ